MTQRDEREKLQEAHAEIQRLQEAKRRALAIADERAKENVALRAALDTTPQLDRLFIGTGEYVRADLATKTVMDLQQNLRHWREECGKLHAKLSALSNAPPASEGVRLKRAWDMLMVLAVTPVSEWRSKTEIQREIQWMRPTEPAETPDVCPGGIDPGWDICPKCGATMDDKCRFDTTPDEGPDPLGYTKGERA